MALSSIYVAAIVSAAIVGFACSRDSAPSRVVKRDGTSIVGTIVEARADGVVVKTSDNSTVTIARTDIASIEAMQPAKAVEVSPQAATPDDRRGATGVSGAVETRERSLQERKTARSDTSDASTRLETRDRAADNTRGASAQGDTARSQDRRSSSGAPSSGSQPASGDASRGTITSPPRQSTEIIPAGTRLVIALKSPIDSARAQRDDPVDATLTRPVRAGDVEALPAGTEIEGSVVDVQSAAPARNRAYLVVQFDRVRVAGRDLPLRSAPIQREAAPSAKRDAKQKIGSAIGAVVGRSKRALAAAGITTSDTALGRGPDVKLPAGTTLTIRLAEPLTVPAPGR